MTKQDSKAENPKDHKKAAKEKKSSGPEYTGYDLDYFVQAKDLFNAVHKLDQNGYFLEDISCLDMEEGFQVVYHLDRFEQPCRVGLRVMLDRHDPRVPSIYNIFPGAAWHERECFDFFGVRFTGHPNLLPLLLDPDHKGPPPLLKDETERKSLEQLYPDREHTPISREDQDFLRKIRDCSNLKSRMQS